MRNTLLSVCALILLAGSIEAQVVNVCYGAQDGLFIPDYTNCSNYYACVNQIGYLQTCPSGYAFDSKAQACNYASVVTCSTCPSNASGLQFIAVPNVCDKYVICAGGSAFMQTCMDGLEYNNETTQCDFSRNVKCNPPPASCPSSTSDVLTFVPNGGECTRYTICYKGTGYIQQCSSELVFNPSQNTCVLASSYTCPTSTSSTAASRNNSPFIRPALEEIELNPSAGCPAVGTKFLPHVRSCSKYIFCVNGKAALLTCANGLHFDRDAEACRPVKDANCQLS